MTPIMIATAFTGGLAVLFVAFRFFSAEVYDMLIVPMTARWYAAILDELAPGTRLVDVGIGTATALAKNADVVRRKRMAVCGFDYEAAYVRKAESVVHAAKLGEQLHVCQADARDPDLASTLGISNGWADAVYFSGSITLIPDSPRVLQNVASLLKPGGRIFITQTFQNQPSPLMAHMKPLLRFLTSVDFGQLTYHADVTTIVKKAGMTIIDDRPIKGSIDTAAQTARMIIIRP